MMVAGDGSIRVIDFGGAQRLPNRVGSLTSVDHVWVLAESFGTDGYLPPAERATGRLSIAVDTYALGLCSLMVLGAGCKCFGSKGLCARRGSCAFRRPPGPRNIPVSRISLT